jgi:uncharacterized ferritin-like protein (DUF455 family)
MTNTTKNYRRVNLDHIHDVKSNALGLGGLYSIEVELARLMGQWIARFPEFPEKLSLAEMIYEEAMHAQMLEERLLELRTNAGDVVHLRARTTSVFKHLEQLDDPNKFLSGLFRVVKPALQAALVSHLDACPPYVDTPTVRMLKLILQEEAKHIATGLSLLAERNISWSETLDFEAELREGLWDPNDITSSFVSGEFVGKEPIALPVPVWPTAVEYLSTDQQMPDWPVGHKEEMQRCVHELVFSELEALDIFGRYVYEFSGFPWKFYVEAARLCWDEARHVELLLNVLERYDGTIGQWPANAPGYEEMVRCPTVLEKIMMVNVIAEGEYSTDTQTQHREAFKQLGDDLSALLKDYEMADEIVHGRFGIKWAHWLADQTGEDFENAYKAAKQSLEEFKAKYADDSSGSDESSNMASIVNIPLIRLGPEETESTRLVNASAKRLVGFSEEQISEMTADASEVIDDT